MGQTALELNFITGSYAVIQVIDLTTGLSEIFNIIDESGTSLSVSLAELLQLRIEQPGLVVEGYGCVSSVEEFNQSCTYSIDQENWGGAFIPNSFNYRIFYDKVVWKDCGDGPVEILRVEEEVVVPSSSWWSFQTNVNMEDGTGFIHSITLKMLNPGGAFNVILNPGLVLTTYPGLTGIVDPNDLIIDYNDFGAIETAIETVINHAIQLQLGGGATYDFAVEAGYSLGNASVTISFLRAFEPAGPHVFIDFNAPFSYYYNGTTPVSGQSDGGWVVNFRSHIEAEYQAPCGPIKSDYDIVLENDELQNPVPRSFAVKSPRYRETITCAETGVEVSLDCGPPLFVFNDPTFVSCDPGVPLPDPEDDGCPDGTTINEDIAEIKTSAQQTNEQNIPIPNAFHRVRFSDGRHMLVLDGELGTIDDCYQDEGTVPIDSNTQVFHVAFPDGGGGNASLGDVLALRAGGMAMSLGGPDPDSPMPGQDPTGTVPEGAVPKFTFFIYDHLGNSRILYTNSLTYCHTDSVKYLLEHVLDYYPFGKTLREYVHVRERFQTTYHERDEESGLDYRGARFYDGDVGRFLSVDPLAVKFPDWSTYSYTLDNPVLLVDPDGRAPIPPDYVRLIFHGGSRRNSHNNTFSNAANNIAKEYTDVKAQVVKFNTADDIINSINSQKDNSIQSVDIVAHGGTHAIYAGVIRGEHDEDSGFLDLPDQNVSLYDSNSRQVSELAWSNGGDIGELNFENFTYASKIELHGCNSCSNAGEVGSKSSNIAAAMSTQLFEAGKKQAVVIGHQTPSTPGTNDDYRHGTRVIYHNGEVLFKTTKAGRISASEINKHLKDKLGDDYIEKN